MIKQKIELDETCYLLSLLHCVHGIGKGTTSLLTEFMTVPLVFGISLVSRLASYDDIYFHPCRIDNSFIKTSVDFHLARRVDSSVVNDLICELIADHIVHGSQSLPCRASHFDHFTNLRVDGAFNVTTHFYLGDKVV